MGQSNIAAGATLGSNHNSRAADGELQTGRGFWPGLCVSLKHNSKLANFTLLAKGDYPAELNIPLPFSLVSNDVTNNKLVVMPAYWFLYNLYALARNAAKYADRDKRTKKLQFIEYSFLAPDSINEIFTGLDLLRKFTAYAITPALKKGDETLAIREGDRFLNDLSLELKSVEVLADCFENANRCTQIIKVREAYDLYKKLVVYYAIEQITVLIEEQQVGSFDELHHILPQDALRTEWLNIGGQLILKTALEALLQGIKEERYTDWKDVHQFYQEEGQQYATQKWEHAFASLLELLNIKKADFSNDLFLTLLQEALDFKRWMTEKIHDSRAKDHENNFRKMAYNNNAEMDEVIGKLEDNVFINQQKAELVNFTARIQQISRRFDLELA